MRFETHLINTEIDVLMLTPDATPKRAFLDLPGSD